MSTLDTEGAAPALADRDLDRGADDWGRTQQVRRRVLHVQLARLAARVGDTDLAARDAAARTLRLASRLEHDELAW